MTNRSRVVAFASSSYADLLALWAEQSAKNIDGPATVVCLDDETQKIARTLPGIEAHGGEEFSFDPKDRQAFWVNRLKTIHRLGQDTNLMIHSDLDAFWLKPAIGLLGEQDFDFAFSIDYGLPTEIVKKWGFILCCGFFAFRPGKRADALMAGWMRETQKYLDDQIAINRLLDGLGISWSEGELQGQPCKIGKVCVEEIEVKFLALPWTLFPRQHPMMEAAGAIVAHPYWERRFHRSFVQTYSIIRDRSGTLPPFDLPPFPGHPIWRPRDWGFLHILEDMAGHQPLSDDQARHLGVLNYRFGRYGKAVSILKDLKERGYTDDHMDVDLVEAMEANGESEVSSRELVQAIKRGKDLRVLQKLAQLAVKQRKVFAAALALFRMIHLILEPRMFRKVSRTLVINLRRRMDL